MSENSFDKILVVDFGSQYTQLIARRVRECGVYSEIWPCDFPLQRLRSFSPKGIIFSGGPASVYEKGAPQCDRRVLETGLPILGICYGMQLISWMMGGRVVKSQRREFGKAILTLDGSSRIFKNIGRKGSKIEVWMSHGDQVLSLPAGFRAIAHSDNTPFAAIECPERDIYGFQFHPEVIHTRKGLEMIRNYLFEICGCTGGWTMQSFLKKTIEDLKSRIDNEKVICALSGGVDSTVVAFLLYRAVGSNLRCIFVNNGLLRKGEASRVVNLFKHTFRIPLIYVDAEMRFLKALRGVTDPERKRKIIGKEFISVFEKEAKKLGNVKFLAQGTLYPDVIESTSFRGPSATIKSHHNVGGLPERMKLELVEPLRELFKDEVRKLGSILGLPDEVVSRQPFPGPGLAIRIIGEVNRERLDVLRQADEIVMEEVRRSRLEDKVWQSFAILLPVKTVGVMGDLRSYENVIAIRVVESMDGMTADWKRLPYDVLENISTRIINEVRGVNRVVYDISSKPPSTIEWE